MKLLAFTFSILVIQAVHCQNAETFTETLLRAQAELSLSHEFTQSQFISHRVMIHSILKPLEKLTIDLFLDSVAAVKSVAAETRAQMASYQTNACTADAQARWDRQVISYGYRLNFCLSESKRILMGEYYELNYFDKDGSRVANQVQNQGFNIMTQYDPVDPANDFYFLVNRRLRDLLLRAGPWVSIMDELIELMNHHTEQAIFGITMCTRVYTSQFNGIAAAALEDIKKCST